MRCHDDGNPKLAVCAKEHGQEVLLGNWVEHRGGLVQEQQARSHGKRCGKREHLSLAAGEACRLPPKPRFHTKEHAGLGHAAAHLGYRRPQVLKAEGHLVPNGVAHDLAVGALEDKAHGLSGLDRRERAQLLAEREHVARERARWRHLQLGQAKKRGLSGARTTREQCKRTLGHGHRDVLEHWRQAGFGVCGGIDEAHVPQLECVHESLPHLRRCPRSSTVGRSTSAA